jgi:uncharacterized RDD family membrane protein YckC
VVPIFGEEPHAVKSGRARTPARSQSSRREAAGEAQQLLAFVSATPVNRATAPAADSAIYCDAPVAHVEHRLLAAGIDAGIVFASLGVFAGVFFFAGGHWEQNPAAWAAGAVIAALITMVYQLFWALSNGDSAGLRIAELELVNFDGRRPDRGERLARILASWLSFLPGGLGLFWSLVDEETLTWHDHISKTFPTPRATRLRMPLRP